MLTPAAIANAVSDALGRDDIVLPLTLRRVWSLANGVGASAPATRTDVIAGLDPAIHPLRKESMQGGWTRGSRPRVTAVDVAGSQTIRPATEPGLTGEGEALLHAPPAAVWRRLIEPQELAAVIPGCRELSLIGPDRYRASVMIGVAGIRAVYDIEMALADKREPESLRLVGTARGALGFGTGEAWVTLTEARGRTRLAYRYEAQIGGKVAAVGNRMLGTVTALLIAELFRAVDRRIAPSHGWRALLAHLFGRGSPS